MFDVEKAAPHLLEELHFITLLETASPMFSISISSRSLLSGCIGLFILRLNHVLMLMFYFPSANLRGSHRHEGRVRLHRHVLLPHPRDGAAEERRGRVQEGGQAQVSGELPVKVKSSLCP